MIRPALPLVGLALFASVGEAQVPLNLGVTQQGSVPCQSQSTFTVPALLGDKILIHVTETSDSGGVCAGVACCCFDITVELRDPQGVLMASVASPFENNSCGHRLRTVVGPVAIPATGDYTISVRDGNNNGRGSFAIWVNSVNQPALAVPLAPGSTLLQPLQTPGDVATFVFPALQGSAIQVENALLTGSVVPRLALYDGSGGPVSLPVAGSLAATAPASGPYTLLAYSQIDQVGTYQVSLAVTDPIVGVFPASGTLATTFEFDLGLVIRHDGHGVVAGSIVYDGVDVTVPLLVAGFLFGAITSGTDGMTLRLPGLSANDLGLGTHTLDASFTLGNGTTANSTATWDVVANVE